MKFAQTISRITNRPLLKSALMTLVISASMFSILGSLSTGRSPAVVTPIVHGQEVNAQDNPFDRAQSASCSLGTMKGTHGYSYSGTVLGSTITAAGPISFDGEGRLSATYDVNLGSTPFRGAFTGTYTVNADCTGTVTLNLPLLGLTSNGKFVIVNGGKETFFTGTDQGVAITGITKKL